MTEDRVRERVVNRARSAHATASTSTIPCTTRLLAAAAAAATAAAAAACAVNEAIAAVAAAAAANAAATIPGWKCKSRLRTQSFNKLPQAAGARDAPTRATDHRSLLHAAFVRAKRVQNNLALHTFT